ncbi:MAG: WYL domain-containing protein [Lachnospiraceae bacterium]|nr:WYL domain-containing protein [Lachnospiraceae bacterium]
MIEFLDEKYINCEKPLPLTNIEKIWIKSILSNRRAKLFFSEESFEILSKEYADIENIYERQSVKYYDKDVFSEYIDDYYIDNFKKILEAIKDKRVIKIDYVSRNGNSLCEAYLPYKILYSAKKEKFELLAFLMHDRKPELAYKIDISRIYEVTEIYREYDDNYDLEKLLATRMCEKPVVLQVFNRNFAYNRIVKDMAIYKCNVEDNEDGTYNVTISYDKQDEGDLLSDILSYGPNVKVIANDKMIEEVKKRALKQYQLLFGNNK